MCDPPAATVANRAGEILADIKAVLPQAPARQPIQLRYLEFANEAFKCVAHLDVSSSACADVLDVGIGLNFDEEHRVFFQLDNEECGEIDGTREDRAFILRRDSLALARALNSRNL